MVKTQDSLTHYIFAFLGFATQHSSPVDYSAIVMNGKKLPQNPSLNTQSCIKGLLGVRDFYFWAVLAARPVQKKKGLGRL